MTTSHKIIPTLDINSFTTILTPTKSESINKKPPKNSQFFISRLTDIDCNNLLDSPFIYDFFTIYFVEKGALHKINQLENLQLKPNEIFFSKPGEVKTWQKMKNLDGYMISFTLDYLLLMVSNKNFINTFDYLLPNAKRKFTLEGPLLYFYQTIFREIIKEYANFQKHSDQMIKLWLFVLLIKTNRIYAKDNESDGLGTSLKSADFIFRRFMLCVEENFTELAQGNVYKPMMIKEYASKLNVNPTYLGECVRKACGKSAKSIINKRTILLAKCQLLHTHNNIAEIAYQLGFESSAYFIRVFKKFEGITPLEYRNRERPKFAV